MSAIQLNFSLRTSANCKTVHLLGSWDNYGGQLPLSKDSAKAGSFKGAFRFQSSMIKQGQRYWYYYILDGYHVSHDPAREHTVEPTTGRKLNILDVPAAATTAVKSSRSSRLQTTSIPKGRPVSPTRIVSPRPYKPGMAANIIATTESASLAQLTARFQQVELEESSDDESDADSDVPSLTGSASSRSSSVSSNSSCCTCERYGITRSGSRVRLDCGGSRCGASSDESDSCASDSENETYRIRQTRRQDPEDQRPKLRIITRFKSRSEDDTSGICCHRGRQRRLFDIDADDDKDMPPLSSFLLQRYSELAPLMMPEHLRSATHSVTSTRSLHSQRMDNRSEKPEPDRTLIMPVGSRAP